MTQSIVVQVGQCGNQIGCRFWDLALREHASTNKSGRYDESLSSFFRNVDMRYEDPKNIPVGNGRGQIKSLKARAVLIDMEEGVVNETLNGPLRDIFDCKQLITDVSGCGNNCLPDVDIPSVQGVSQAAVQPSKGHPFLNWDGYILKSATDRWPKGVFSLK